MSRVDANPEGAISVEALNLTMRFGDFTALDRVSLRVEAGSFHALLGENGAGKSTLVKCLMGFNRATEGEILVAGREARLSGPKSAQALGLGMVYQHFTLVPSLTVAENLVISRRDAPKVIDWNREMPRLRRFMESMPFSVPLDARVGRLAAGQKQKLEILKQLYLGSRFLVLDEPTSVLTPGEAEEVLGHVRALTLAGQLTVLMITHKFQQVSDFADTVTVLRRGRHAGGGRVADLSHDEMATMMMGGGVKAAPAARHETDGPAVLELDGIRARDRSGLKEIALENLALRAGEILGVAGVSGNGQTELMEILTGQRDLIAGQVRVSGEPYRATRAEARRHRVRYLPEEPLHTACAPGMSVADNLGFRIFDRGGRAIWIDRRALRENAERMISAFDIRARSAQSPIRTLSGGNVQRAALARELSGDVALLIVSNPCFGLDFSAVQAIRDRLIEARNNGVAVLLISEDLDEILTLSDRVVVMSEGRIRHETTAAEADPAEIGRHMAAQG